MKKEFDAVKMMRDIRNKLADRYLETPELEDKELEKVRKKYSINLGAYRNVSQMRGFLKGIDVSGIREEEDRL